MTLTLFLQVATLTGGGSAWLMPTATWTADLVMVPVRMASESAVSSSPLPAPHQSTTMCPTSRIQDIHPATPPLPPPLATTIYRSVRTQSVKSDLTLSPWSWQIHSGPALQLDQGQGLVSRIPSLLRHHQATPLAPFVVLKQIPPSIFTWI